MAPNTLKSWSEYSAFTIARSLVDQYKYSPERAFAVAYWFKCGLISETPKDCIRQSISKIKGAPKIPAEAAKKLLDTYTRRIFLEGYSR